MSLSQTANSISDEDTIAPAGPAHPRRMLVLDTSYTMEMIRARGLEDSVTCRDLDGFFDHVWTVHPFASLLTSESWARRFGKPVLYHLSSKHTFIEGKVGQFSFVRRIFPLNFLLAQSLLFVRMLLLIRREKIGVIRVGSPLYLGLFGLGLARIAGIPLVIRVGGNNDKAYETTGLPVEPRLTRSRKIEKVIERFVFPRADLVAGANQDNLNFALANGARPDRSTLFRYGNLIDKRHFTPPERRQFDPDILREIGFDAGEYLLYIGRLEPVKHPDDVVRVLQSLDSRGHTNIKALLVGDGAMRGAIEQLVRESGLEGRVAMPGNKDQGWLAQVIAQAAIVVSPHTGRALTEAALGASPVIAYDVDWQAELIESGVTGELVPHKDWKAMAEAAARLLDDREYARILGRALRSRTLEMLDPATLDEHERREYTKLLEGWAATRSRKRR